MIGAAGLALATSASLTLYATLLYRVARARVMRKGPDPFKVPMLIANGVALELIVLWSCATGTRPQLCK